MPKKYHFLFWVIKIEFDAFKVTVYWWNFFSPVVGHVLLSSKTYFSKISVSGGPWNIHFCFSYLPFALFLIVITARRPLKLAILATNSVIPATICSLVFYSHINAISSLYQDSTYRFHAIPKPALSMRIWWL